MVAPRSDGPYVLAVDVAVERIVTATVGLGGVVHERRQVAIDGSARRLEAVISRIAADAEWLAARRPGGGGPVGVGVSIPGTVRRRDGYVEHAPNLNWRAVPFAQLLAEAMGGPDVQIGNDADLGAVAEHQRGAATGYDHLVYLNGSVGVGGGIISEGNPLHGSGGYAGEIGHMTINPDGPPCHCGSTGCIETYIGEHALLRAAGVTGRHGPRAVDAVFIDAASGDPVAQQGGAHGGAVARPQPGQPGQLLQPAGDRGRRLAGRGGPAGTAAPWRSSWTGGRWPPPGPACNCCCRASARNRR